MFANIVVFCKILAIFVGNHAVMHYEQKHKKIENFYYFCGNNQQNKKVIYSLHSIFDKKYIKFSPKKVIKKDLVKQGIYFNYYKFIYSNNELKQIEEYSSFKLKRYLTIKFVNKKIFIIDEYNSKKLWLSRTRYYYREDNSVYRSSIYLVVNQRHVYRIHDIDGNVIETSTEQD